MTRFIKKKKIQKKGRIYEKVIVPEPNSKNNMRQWDLKKKPKLRRNRFPLDSNNAMIPEQKKWRYYKRIPFMDMSWCLFLNGVVILSAVAAPVNWSELEESLAADRACAAVASCSELGRWSSNNVIGRLSSFSGSCDRRLRCLRIGGRLDRSEREEGNRPLDVTTWSRHFYVLFGGTWVVRVVRVVGSSRGDLGGLRSVLGMDGAGVLGWWWLKTGYEGGFIVKVG